MRKPSLPAASAIVGALLAAAPAAAQNTFDCINPVAPLCMDMMEARISEDACVVEVRQYVASLDEYAACLETSAEEARQESARVRDTVGIDETSDSGGGNGS